LIRHVDYFQVRVTRAHLNGKAKSGLKIIDGVLGVEEPAGELLIHNGNRRSLRRVGKADTDSWDY
jgi:hypothetical protein